MMVKICGITNRDDALAAADAGATALGFNFYPQSPRYVTPDVVEAILEVLPRTVLTVGVFVNEPAANVSTLAHALGLHAVQLHGESVEFPDGLRIWRAVRVTAGFDVSGLSGIPAHAFLLDTPSGDLHGGTGQTFDWSLARAARGQFRVIIAGGLDEENVRDAIETGHPWGVDACSRLESAPGRKNHRKMSQFIKAALS
jgi:phosphoribosylanthranilate isomerase